MAAAVGGVSFVRSFGGLSINEEMMRSVLPDPHIS
jgi:hypothetical protein